MLVNIIKDYLQLPANKVEYLTALLTQEGCWQETLYWKGKKYDPAHMRSQADVIKFLQAFCQSQWFNGHDRLKFPENHANHLKKHFFSLFEGVGLTQSVDYNVLNNPPDFSVILGSTESDVLSRVDSLKQDLLANSLPKEHMIFGLGSNRLLGYSDLDSEDYSKRKLLKLNQDQTEMNMVTLLTCEGLDDLKSKDSRFSKLSYQAINTASPNSDRVKTVETAINLKYAIENSLGFRAKKTVYLAVYSNQPYILRQQRDMQQALGTDYFVAGVGAALTQADFDRNNKSVSELLGEIARLVHINYRAEYLEQFNIALTTTEIAEIYHMYRQG
jgi:hypothetical protein